MDEIFKIRAYAYARESDGIVQLSKANCFDGFFTGFPLYTGQQVAELLQKTKDKAYREGLEMGWDQHRHQAAVDDNNKSTWWES